jgi:hypothetical protein
VVNSVPLHAALSVATASIEGSARAAKAIECAFPPGDVTDAAKNQQSPGEVRAVVMTAEILGLASLDQGVPVAVIIGIVDQPEPTQNE